METQYRDKGITNLLGALDRISLGVQDLDPAEILKAYQEAPTDREKEVLSKYLGLEDEAQTLKKIGDHYGLTRERVRQIKEKGLHRIRQAVGLKRKDSESGLIKRVSGIISIIGLGAAVLFLSPSVTGNAIGSVNSSSLNIISVVGFLIGLIGAFFYFKK